MGSGASLFRRNNNNNNNNNNNKATTKKKVTIKTPEKGNGKKTSKIGNNNKRGGENKACSKEIFDFLSSSWPGSILRWSENDIEHFASCFTPHHVGDGKEISTSDPNSFFIVSEGAVEVHAILPTKCRKTDNIREFLCKKNKGDMVYMPSVRDLIEESSANEIYEREDKEHREHSKHKSVLHLIDSVEIKSAMDSTILQLDWLLFREKFGDDVSKPRRLISVDVEMLRTIMETNISDYLVRLPILENVSYLKLETLARLCRYSMEKAGQVICEEGDVGDEVYIVLKGKVKVEAKASQRMVDILDNEKELPPSLPSDDIDAVPRKMSVTFQCDQSKSQRQLTTGRKTLAHRRRTLFQATDSCRKEAFKTALSCPSFDENATAKKEDKEIDILKKNQTVELAMLGVGDYFGEMATFIELPRSATVTAVTNVLMVSISKTDFKTLYHAISPGLEASVEQMVKRHMLQNLFHLKSPFLERIGTESACRMADELTITKVDRGTILFREGEEANKFYFIYSGSLSVQKMNGRSGLSQRIGFLYPGDYFGEMAVINESKRLATITAETDSILLEITRDKFYKCFQETPWLIAEFIVRMKGKGVDLQSLLHYKKSMGVFINFLGSHDAKHLIDFCNAANSFYDQFDEMDSDAALQMAMDISKKYFGNDDTDNEKSISKDISEFAREAIASGVIPKDTFCIAEQKVKQIMENEMLPSFKKTDEFKSLMERMRAYDEMDVQLLA